MAHNFLLKRARKLDLISSFSEAAEGALPFALLLGPELEQEALANKSSPRAVNMSWKAVEPEPLLAEGEADPLTMACFSSSVIASGPTILCGVA